MPCDRTLWGGRGRDRETAPKCTAAVNAKGSAHGGDLGRMQPNHVPFTLWTRRCPFWDCRANIHHHVKLRLHKVIPCSTIYIFITVCLRL